MLFLVYKSFCENSSKFNESSLMINHKNFLAVELQIVFLETIKQFLVLIHDVMTSSCKKNFFNLGKRKNEEIGSKVYSK